MAVPANRSVRKQILVTEKTNKQLNELSDKKGESVNSIINKAVECYLKRFTFEDEEDGKQ